MASSMQAKIQQMTSGNTAGNDSKYFQTTKKGEIHELKEELCNPKMEKKKEAVKKVIAAMTVGKDVSMLFADVVNCMQTSNIELKKLVYLYLINYAKSQPDLALLAVNTFVKDTADPNPLIRALAVRTMGCIRIKQIFEYLAEPLRKCLQDEDPYVRKTAAVCVAKLYDISAEMVEDHQFLEMLHELLGDSNPMVVSNAVAALAEISETSDKGRQVFKITSSTLQKLLAALNECTEWGQVFILDSLATYKPEGAREAEPIIERVTPRLQHANSAVVLSAVKVIMMYMDQVTNQEALKNLYRKMAPPLVTLLSSEPEVQYVALRNINLIVQKKPQILAHETKVFFCKYNDPIYVKMEKLEIMIKLASERNVDQVLMEFKEYATEVDVEFVRRSVRAIGRCAIKLERAAERCINVLLELIQTKVNYVVQEAVIVIKDIFRKFPNRYESIIGTLCENLDTLDEPEAKASMIWIIGEYAERIDNSDELLESFLETFDDETPLVQLQLLTATVKLFLKKPQETQATVQNVLNMATQHSDNPDLRDRGYIYWRLLSIEPEAAKHVVLAEKPTISDDSNTFEIGVLNSLLSQLASLSSVYHKPPETFVTGSAGRALTRKSTEETEPEEADESSDMQERSDGGITTSAEPTPIPTQEAGPVGDLLGDLMGLDMGGGGSSQPAATPSSDPMDMLGLGGGMGGPPPAASGPPQNLLLPAEKGEGMTVRGRFVLSSSGTVGHEMTIQNGGQAPLSGFAIQYNKNSFGLNPENPGMLGQLMPPQLMPGQSHTLTLPLKITPQVQDSGVVVQMAVKNNVKVHYFQDSMNMAFLSPDGKLDQQTFLTQFQSIPDSGESSVMLMTSQQFLANNFQLIKSKMEAAKIFMVAQKQGDNKAMLYASCKTMNNVVLLIELTLAPNGQCKCAVKTQTPQYSKFVHHVVDSFVLK